MRHKNPIIMEHLALISVKYDVILSELYQALYLAKETGEAQCGKLSIKYRGVTKDKAIFLIIKESKTVIQFHIKENLLNQKDLPFESLLNTEKIRSLITRQNMSLPVSLSIQHLRNGMKKVNLEAEVLNTQEPQRINTQFGTKVMLTNITIGDKTGQIKLCLWGEQEKKTQKGDIIKIENASVRTNNGKTQLNLGHYGNFSIIKNIHNLPK